MFRTTACGQPHQDNKTMRDMHSSTCESHQRADHRIRMVRQQDTVIHRIGMIWHCKPVVTATFVACFDTTKPSPSSHVQRDDPRRWLPCQLTVDVLVWSERECEVPPSRRSPSQLPTCPFMPWSHSGYRDQHGNTPTQHMLVSAKVVDSGIPLRFGRFVCLHVEV